MWFSIEGIAPLTMVLKDCNCDCERTFKAKYIHTTLTKHNLGFYRKIYNTAFVHLRKRGCYLEASLRAGVSLGDSK